MNKQFLEISNKLISFPEIKNFLKDNQQILLNPESIEKIKSCRDYLDKKIKNSKKLFYGINTGFGFLQNIAINLEDLETLQKNLLLSHACGIGEEVPEEIVKLMLLLKIKALSLGHSGISIETVERLVELYNLNCIPIVYTQGSLGASGDLAPLSHLALPLIGMGEVRLKGERMDASKALSILNLKPIHLKNKEGLALINGTQFMNGYGLFILQKAEHLIRFADWISCLSLFAFDALLSPFAEILHQLRPHNGQIETAKFISSVFANYELQNKDINVQDPYSFRCIPQVHGATKDAFKTMLAVFEIESNSVTDNPIIFPEADKIISGGHFHGQPLALQLDFFAIAMSELGNISERRTFQLLSGQRGLPIFLIKSSGLNSGLMIPQYTAASIVSENKQLSTPASIDSIPSSNNQEDHVSMGANAATKCLRVINNVEKILAIELLTAMQAIEFKKDRQIPEKILLMYNAFRQKISFIEKDRFLHQDIKSTIHFMKEFSFND